jgi:hypothetical protein
MTAQIQTWHEVFSPTILETTVPKRFIDIVNEVGDDVLNNEKRSTSWDFSDKLVGKVHKEIQIPIRDKSDKKYLSDIMKQGCLDYLNYMMETNRAYNWYKIRGSVWKSNPQKKPTIDNIHLAQSWIVSQYAGEYNPWHKHSGDFSAVIYLKLPAGMEEEYKEDEKDHYPANGRIEFMYGEACDFRSDGVKFKPEVGKFLLFPSYLKHFVYPFYIEGERRSMSFNAHMKT